MALILKLENDIEIGLSNTRTKAIIRRLELSFQIDENKPNPITKHSKYRKMFSSKTEVLNYLETSMGTEGSTEQANKLYELMKDKSLIHINDQACGDCIEVELISDQYFFELWEQITKTN